MASGSGEPAVAASRSPVLQGGARDDVAPFSGVPPALGTAFPACGPCLYKENTERSIVFKAKARASWGVEHVEFSSMTRARAGPPPPATIDLTDLADRHTLRGEDAVEGVTPALEGEVPGPLYLCVLLEAVPGDKTGALGAALLGKADTPWTLCLGATSLTAGSAAGSLCGGRCAGTDGFAATCREFGSRDALGALLNEDL
mmetsp:Transcript_6987/g.15048  ORF Transcript_6987/g.15048 Transcript_6987/m.15048 type:complete len:201 (+) Transcript_6987:350-952(+)